MNEHDILADPAASTWLKEQIELSKTRDVVDAMNDAEALFNVLNERFLQSLATFQTSGDEGR